MKTVLTMSAVGLALAAAAFSASSAAASTVKLSNAENGRTVSLRRTDVVPVHLRAIRGAHEKWVWDVPRSSSPEVLSRTSGGTSPGGDAEATFRAVDNGSSDITAHRRCIADPGYACPHVIIPWKVTAAVH